MFKPKDKITVLRDLKRAEGAYARKGDEGVVLEIFYTGTSGYEHRPYAKCEMKDGSVKTFRLSSIGKSTNGKTDSDKRHLDKRVRKKRS